MWKLLVGFAIFAALALFILSKGGNIDMGGEKHDVAAHGDAPADVASTAASGAAVPAASAASN